MINIPNNDISSIGCKYLNPCLIGLKLKKLKLDYNPIGSNGIKELVQALSCNKDLERLSLNYCQIDLNGVKYL